MTHPSIPRRPPPLPGGRLHALRTGFAPWSLLDEEGVWPAGSGVRRELEVGAQVARTGRGLIRLWRSDRSLVVTRREARLPHFAAAREAAEREGWPVVVRDSGGTTVPHLPGALQVSLFLPRTAKPQGNGGAVGPALGRGQPAVGIEDVYYLLCEPVRVALRRLGLRTGYGEIPGSFCDGRFNLVHGSRKVAGTAQRWKGGVPGVERAGGYVLGHMVLFVEGDLAEATEAVNRLLRRGGGEGRFRPDALDTVSAGLARSGCSGCGAAASPLVETVRAAVREVVERRFPMAPGARVADGSSAAQGGGR